MLLEAEGCLHLKWMRTMWAKFLSSLRRPYRKNLQNRTNQASTHSMRLEKKMKRNKAVWLVAVQAP